MFILKNKQINNFQLVTMLNNIDFCIKRNGTMRVNDKQGLAKTLYLYGDMSQKEIAHTLNVAEKTITAWKQKDNWEAIRVAKITQADTIIQELYANITEIFDLKKAEERPLTHEEVMMIRKLGATIKDLNSEHDLATYAQVFSELMKFGKTAEIPWFDDLRDLTRQFLEAKAKKFTV